MNISYDPYRDLDDDGLSTPLVWQPGISGEDGIIVPIKLRCTECPDNPHLVHIEFRYLTQPNLLEIIFLLPAFDTATRYHSCLN